MTTSATAASRPKPVAEGAPPRRLQQARALPWVLAVVVLLAAGGGVWWWKAHPAAGGPAGPARAGSGAADGAPAGGGPGAGPAGGGAGGAAGAGGPGGRRFGGANRTQPVSVARVRRQDIRVSVQAIGSITASNTAIVRAQVSGVLQKLNFNEGQQVKAGQVLAQIDPRVFQAALDQAAGNLARDRAQLENARVDLDRYRDLLTKDAVPRQQLDTQQALVRQLEGTIKVDQAALASAQLQLSYSRVTAPISGRVGLKQVDLGNVVTPGDVNGVVVITQTRPIALVFAVPSQHVPLITERLHSKEPLPVEAWDRTGTKRLAVGTLATLDNSIDVATDTIKLKALFANTDDALFPNQAVSVRLQLATQSDVLAVPQAAVLRGAQGFYVYVVNADSSVSVRTVKPGAVDADWTAVDGRLQAGEQVVIDGVDRLRDGAKVEVIAADPRQRAGASAPAGGRRGGRGGGASGASGAGAGGPRGADPTAAAGRPASGPEPATPADAALRYRPPGAASQPRAASAATAGAEERPAWMDRLPPEVADKLMKMSPDERREWMRKRREERARQSDGG